MAYFSDFVAHWVANTDCMPAAVSADIRRAGLARVSARWAAGRGDEPLTFDDLIDRIENAVAGVRLIP
jgi:hypothetical protein